jgi:hypothetical protein
MLAGMDYSQITIERTYPLKKSRARQHTVAALSLIAIISLAGCGAHDGNDTVPAQSTAEEPDTGLALPVDDSPRQNVSVNNPPDTDSPAIDDRLTVDDPADDPTSVKFEIAEYFFTEDDRQWFCSVTTAVSAFTDQFYLDRFGGANFERFGVAEWSSHDELEQLDVVTALGVRFAINEIFATNTVLEFQLQHDSESAELYDCVLTTREIYDL